MWKYLDKDSNIVLHNYHQFSVIEFKIYRFKIIPLIKVKIKKMMFILCYL